jgi:PST family polysaccharide transporter
VFLVMLEFLAMAASPIFIGVALVAPELVPLALGDQWRPSIAVMTVLAVAGALRVIQVTTATLLLAIGRPDLQLKLTAITTTIAVTGFLVVVRQGIVAVALIHVVAGLLVAPLQLGVLVRAAGIELQAYLRALRAPVIALGAMSLLVLSLRRSSVGFGVAAADLGLMVLAGAAVYLAAAWLVARPRLEFLRQALSSEVVARGGPRPDDPSFETTWSP